MIDENKLSHGHNIIGKCLGIKRSTQNGYNNVDLGISVSRPDGYGGFVEETTDIRLYGDIGERIISQAARLTGKEVSINLNLKALLSKAGNPYLSIKIHSNSNLIELPTQNKLAKVS